MLIPNKFSGYSFDGVRRCFGGAGGGGGGDGGTGGDPASIGDSVSTTSSATPGGPGSGDNTQTYTNRTGVNTNRGAITGMNFNNTGNTGNNAITQSNFDSNAYLAANPDVASELNRGVANFGDAYGHYTRYGMNEGRQATALNANTNTAGTSTINRDNLNLRNMAGMPYNQVGQQYNALLQQGYTGNDIRNALTTNGKPVSDSDYGFLVQDAAMKSPTGRPMAGSDQFFQPVYSSQYQNYARPSTQFDVSTYGTQPMNSPAFNSGMSRGNINNTIENFYKTNPMGRDAPMSDTLNFMRDSGVNREDFQSWAGKNNYGPQMSMPSAQTQQPFNPYTNSSGYGGFGGGFGGGYMPQMQSPFSFQQPSYQQQSYQPSYQQQSYQPSYQPSYQQQSYQPSYQPQYNPYQMQSPFSYQQPAAQPNYGPSQAIIGRSSQMRGTPNVMRRAEGGIASLMDDVE